jgi:hypothetical protein
MKKVSINFHNMWGGFDKNNNIITNTLRLLYNVEISENPDISICQVSPPELHAPPPERFATKGKNKVVHWMVESIDRTGEPDYHRCDFSITSCRFNDPRNTRVPLWSMYVNWFGDQKESYEKGRNQAFLVSCKKLLAPIKHTEKKKFCCILTNNDMGIRKNHYPAFINLSMDNGLMTESRGRFLQNMPPLGGDELDKLSYIDSFKFNMCYDNGEYDGWITEKLIHPIYKGCIPIYWGCKTVGEEFNKDRFIHARNYDNIHNMWDDVMELTYNKRMFKEIQSQPCFPNNKIPDCANPEHLIEKLKRIVES